VALLAIAVFGLAFLVPAFTMLATGPIHVPIGLFSLLVLGFGMLAVLSSIGLARFSARVAVNSDGLWYLRGKSKPSFIPWSDVARVEAHDTAQGLVLVDARDGAKIRLGYQLQNFGKLREFVLSHASPTAVVPATLPNIFHRVWINKLIFLAIIAFFLFMAYEDKSQSQFLLLAGAGFTVFGLVAIALDPMLVEIIDSGVVVKYPGWKRTIPFDDISGITQMDMPSRGTVWPVVMLLLKKGKVIKLSGFREGSIALRDAIHSAWVSAGGQDRFPAI